MSIDETTAEVIASLAVVIGLVVLRWLILRYVHRWVEDPDVWFRAKRIATYTFTFVAIVTLAWIWIDAFDALPTYLGLVSAGVAIALSDLLKNMAGWLYILVRRPGRDRELGRRRPIDRQAHPCAERDGLHDPRGQLHGGIRAHLARGSGADHI